MEDLFKRESCKCMMTDLNFSFSYYKKVFLFFQPQAGWSLRQNTGGLTQIHILQRKIQLYSLCSSQFYISETHATVSSCAFIPIYIFLHFSNFSSTVSPSLPTHNTSELSEYRECLTTLCKVEFHGSTGEISETTVEKIIALCIDGNKNVTGCLTYTTDLLQKLNLTTPPSRLHFGSLLEIESSLKASSHALLATNHTQRLILGSLAITVCTDSTDKRVSTYSVLEVCYGLLLVKPLLPLSLPSLHPVSLSLSVSLSVRMDHSSLRDVRPSGCCLVVCQFKFVL